MRIQKVIHNTDLYHKLIELDKAVFYKCYDEFKPNREWFIILVDGKIIAYSGHTISERICIFVRMWVSPKYRGRGIQSKMIRKRIASAKKHKCTNIITYTSIDNVPSSNNLIKNGFRLYTPSFEWVGNKYLYWKLYD